MTTFNEGRDLLEAVFREAQDAMAMLFLDELDKALAIQTDIEQTREWAAGLRAIYEACRPQ